MRRAILRILMISVVSEGAEGIARDRLGVKSVVQERVRGKALKNHGGSHRLVERVIISITLISILILE